MKEKVRYTDEPMKFGKVIPDFLPSPDKLIFREDGVKVTITLSSRSVLFFKDEAAKRGVQYQRMIRRLLDAYVDAFSPNRVEQSRGVYRKAATKLAKKDRRPNAATARAVKEAGSILSYSGRRIRIDELDGGVAVKKASKRARG